MISVDFLYPSYGLIFIHIEQPYYRLKAILHTHFVSRQVLIGISHKVITKLRVVGNMVMDKLWDPISIDCISYLPLDIIMQGRPVDITAVMLCTKRGITTEGIVRDNMVISEVIKLA